MLSTDSSSRLRQPRRRENDLPRETPSGHATCTRYSAGYTSTKGAYSKLQATASCAKHAKHGTARFHTADIIHARYPLLGHGLTALGRGHTDTQTRVTQRTRTHGHNCSKYAPDWSPPNISKCSGYFGTAVWCPALGVVSTLPDVVFTLSIPSFSVSSATLASRAPS